MSERSNVAGSWPLGTGPTLARSLPDRMLALTLHRDRYGPPSEVIDCEEVPVPRLEPADAGRVLVSILASGPNFNTNFAALGLPVPVFGRGDSSTLHIPGSDALGIVVDAGPAVTAVRVGQAVILDSWTGHNIRGYETHDGFNAQFAVVDEERALPVPPGLSNLCPEQLAPLMLTYGTAYRAVVERLDVGPDDSVLVMGGGKGTSFAGAQIAKALGARVILVGSNRELGDALIERGFADAFLDRRGLPAEVFGVIEPDEDPDSWWARTQPFRDAVHAANAGRPVDKIFEHTGGLNFPLLTSALAEGGAIAFFGATGQGLKGEYKETFFYDSRRFVLDARWVWMRQKQILFRKDPPRAIFDEIGLLPGRRGLVWGADGYAREFVEAALERRADLAVIASSDHDADGIAALLEMGVGADRIIDRDAFDLESDMPDPLTGEGTPNPDYAAGFMQQARAVGRAVWEVFGPRVSPDFIVERPDQSTLHYSTFLLRDFDETDAMPTGFVVARGRSDLSVLGSHMYAGAQARETVRLLAGRRIVMDQEDLDVVALTELPVIQQKMLDGTMTRPKGVALVQADRPGRSVADYEADYLGATIIDAEPAAGRFVDVRLVDGVAVLTITRPDALNALNDDLVTQLAGVVDEISSSGTVGGEAVGGLILRGSGRAFVAGADIGGFVGRTAAEIERMANDNMAVFTALEDLEIPVVSVIDGFALGGGNELAMSTHHRIVTENAALGQPEVKLGIIPGYGGMQRLPRLVGPRRAAEMAANGESVGAREAVSIGLAHEFRPASTALVRAFVVVKELMEGTLELEPAAWAERAVDQQAELSRLLESEPAAALQATGAPGDESAGDLVSARRYAAGAALEAMRFGYEHGFAAGLANDARLFGETVTSASGRFWIERFLAKDPEQAAFLTILEPNADRSG